MKLSQTYDWFPPKQLLEALLRREYSKLPLEPEAELAQDVVKRQQNLAKLKDFLRGKK